MTVAKPSAFAWIQPGRSTTRTGAVRSLATRPVNSRTSGVEWSAPARSSSTASAASARETCGPSPTRRDPTRTARSQSTIPGGSAAVAHDRDPTPHLHAPRAPAIRSISVAPRAPSAGHPVGDTTKTIRAPVTSLATPASPCTPVSVPVLARTRPRAAAGPSSKRYGQRSGEPATGSPVSTSRSWVVRGRGEAEHGEQRLRCEPVAAREPAAVVQGGAGDGDADLGAPS